MNLALWLQRTASTRAEQPALFHGAEPVATYGEFARRARAIASALVDAMHIVPGDRVALFAGNSTAYLELLYGIWYAGAAAVPINAKLHPAEAAWIITDAGAGTVFCDAGHETGLSERLPGKHRLVAMDDRTLADLRNAAPVDTPVQRSPDDMAWLFYTSGTTGKPKGVMISHGNIQAMALTYLADVDTVSPGDAALYAAPLSHGAGLYNVQHVLIGARHVVPPSGAFDPAEILALSAGLRDVHLFAAPTMVRRLIDAARHIGSDGDGIRTIVYGGGPMYLQDIVEAVEVMGPRFCQIYGQGESPMTITALPRALVADRSHPRWRERLASVGTAQSCVELRIAAADGTTLPAGETGEVLVRGATVMQGYWNNPAATATTLRDGWLWTGDIGQLDDDGFLTLMDRSKDVIISGGSNIYPREVEEVLLRQADVREVAVVGRPDADWGEVVVAFIVGDEERLAAAMLDAHCLDHIARFKRPKEYRFVGQLPKNNYGKVLKTALRQMLENPDE